MAQGDMNRLEPAVRMALDGGVTVNELKEAFSQLYASEEAYQQHLKTDHFQKYKQGTLHMVKDLKLPVMKPLDPETMKLIFNKIKR